MNKVTLEFLRKKQYIKPDIDFLIINKLIGMPFELFNDIECDTYNIFYDLKSSILLHTNIDWIEWNNSYYYTNHTRYDNNYNIIYQKEFDGVINLYKYDSNNKLIYKKVDNGFDDGIFEYKYDIHGNCIWKNINGDITEWKAEYKYDEYGNCILEKNNDNIREYKYDNHGNIIWESYNGAIVEYIVNYYPDGQLNSIISNNGVKLYIPYFEKQ